ncbi:adenosine receptor A3-like [Ambystoma mexicanum]|uniref:adenosine receptor A3-like n=1 Tax=Ambystoma mexicanum TaxID=8296 RepID=UPI0037E999F7
MAADVIVLNKQDLFYIIMEVLILLFAVIGNVLVIWAVWLNPKLQTPTFYFIVSLAIADLAVGFVVVPLAIVVSLRVQIPFYGCLFMCCLLIIFTHVSILSLLAIAIDRYLRVKIPTRYKMVASPGRIWVGIGMCWLVSSLMGFVPMFGWNERARIPGNGVNSSHEACAFTSVVSMDFMVYFSSFGWIFSPLIAMLFLYAEIFYRIRKLLSQNATNTKDARQYYRKEKKIAKSLALVMLFFGLSWLPLCILNCLLLFSPGTPIPVAVFDVAILLSHANSGMNPIVYTFKIKTFKGTCMYIIKTCILRKPGTLQGVLPQGQESQSTLPLRAAAEQPDT